MAIKNGEVIPGQFLFRAVGESVTNSLSSEPGLNSADKILGHKRLRSALTNVQIYYFIIVAAGRRGR